ncbi:hypothetical protein CK203_038883 [Vitis vinifera]|uniref:Uncharacterized protein n=1 Tax=Vitis vinifera TaxID=29760 RepID=A0A438HG24_VITVI|nr:hypothetical protein CK203_038883 [Vitis vinifera]
MDNHFPTSRPHLDIAAATQRPHPVPKDRRLRRETHSWLTQAARPILCKHRSLATWAQSHSLENPGRILSGFNRASTTSLGDIVLRSKLAQSLSTYNFRWYKIYHPSMSSWAHMAALHESHPLYISSNGKFPYQGWAN